MSTPDSTDKVKALIAGAPVVIFSKTYCPYCKTTEALFSSIAASSKVCTIYLDEEENGVAMQASLAEITGQRTVPNVFVAGKHLGGNDSVQGLHRGDQLVPMVRSAGAGSA